MTDEAKRGRKPEADKPVAKHAFRINRDFWDEQGNRHYKGTIVELTADEALEGVENGILSRLK